MVHRDVKADNVMLARPSGWEVKLVDFGSALELRPTQILQVPPLAKTAQTNWLAFLTVAAVPECVRKSCSRHMYKVDLVK